MCSLHFAPDDFTDFSETELKQSAVPSRHLTLNHSWTCCLPRCGHLPRINAKAPTCLFSWPADDARSSSWFESLKSVISSRTLRIGEARVCSRHFKPTDLDTSSGHRPTLLSAAVPSVDPAEIEQLVADESAKCSIVNCRGSGAFRFPESAPLRKLWSTLAWRFGNTLAHRHAKAGRRLPCSLPPPLYKICCLYDMGVFLRKMC